MTSKEHHKHSKLARPAIGHYCRNEWAILGSTCTVIQTLAANVMKALESNYTFAYLDASHKEEAAENEPALIRYESHPGHDLFRLNKKLNAFRFRQAFTEADVALTNGNHLKARSQIVIIDESKESSLLKRVNDLSDPE